MKVESGRVATQDIKEGIDLFAPSSEGVLHGLGSSRESGLERYRRRQRERAQRLREGGWLHV